MRVFVTGLARFMTVGGSASEAVQAIKECRLGFTGMTVVLPSDWFLMNYLDREEPPTAVFVNCKTQMATVVREDDSTESMTLEELEQQIQHGL